ncbi:hypothetical protein Tco_0666859 [Tanacetum coccineum]
MDGWFFHLFSDVAKYGRTYNRPVERSGDGKPSWTFGQYGTLMLEHNLGVSDCNKVWLEFDSMDQVESVKTFKGTGGSAIVIMAPGKESFRVSYRNRTYRIIATEFASWRPILNRWCQIPSLMPLERRCRGPSLDESLENEEHLDVDSCDSDSPKNVNNDLVSPSSRVLREEDVCGVESDLVDSFEEGEIRDDSVLYNDGCIKDCMEKNLEDDAGEILGVHSQGDCDNVTTDDNEDVTQVIAPEKDSIIEMCI